VTFCVVGGDLLRGRVVTFCVVGGDLLRGRVVTFCEGWGTDGSRERRATCRYLYPLQTPISDRGAQRKRMDGVRAALGWRLVGCELIECYQ
jgi:hypothetical protein